MPVLRNIGRLATCRPEGGQGDVHAIDRAALVWEGETITWTGPEAELPSRYAEEEGVDAERRLVTPGLVECHTHLLFGGSRADEFDQRVRGATYLEIARRGGGIQRTVRETRAASDEELLASARRHLRDMARLGITTVECKSGYGLSLEQELRHLRLYRRLQEEQPLRLVPTLLGAHVVAPEYRENRERYVELLTEEIVPLVAAEGLARFCDAFVEEGAFSSREARCILSAARQHGLGIKLHVDQLSDVGGGELAAELGATSADHLEHISEAGIRAMAEAGVVAVSLPLAAFFLHQPAMPARRLVSEGVPVAVSTDFNPGSSPTFHLPLALLLATVRQGMTAAEALKGATVMAARALALEDEIGSLEPGKRADFLLVDAPDPEHWLYQFRANAVAQTWVGGRLLPLDAGDAPA